MNLSPLILQPVNNTAADVVARNLEATFKRGYKPFVATQTQQPHAISIVGAGPSLAWTYKDLTGDVMACNSAHDYLIAKGVIPAYAFVWDAHPIMAGMIEKPHKDVKYLIASRCHPSVFEKLKDCDVTVWHALGAEDIEKYLMAQGSIEPLVAGGCASVTRAMYVSAAMGYTKEQHLFGVDSCHTQGKSHVNGALTEPGRMQISVCGRWFTISPWMAMQAGDFKILGPLMRSSGVRIVVHGEGLIPFCASVLGFETPDLKVGIYEKCIRRPFYSVRALYDVIRSTPLHGGSYACI